MSCSIAAQDFEPIVAGCSWSADCLSLVVYVIVTTCGSSKLELLLQNLIFSEQLCLDLLNNKKDLYRSIDLVVLCPGTVSARPIQH